MAVEIRNAKITSTSLTIEDHGLLSAWLYLDYGGSGQGFGGYRLDRRPEHPSANDFGAFFIRRTMEAIGVERWEKLPGTPCRVKQDHCGVYAIGHFIEDKWFCTKDLATELGLRKESDKDEG